MPIQTMSFSVVTSTHSIRSVDMFFPGQWIKMGRIHTPGVIACVMQFFSGWNRSDEHLVDQNMHPHGFSIHPYQPVALIMSRRDPLPTSARQHVYFCRKTLNQ